MEMPDVHPIDPHAQTPETKQDKLSPSSTLSSNSSKSSSSSTKPQHRRFLSLDSLENTGNKILTHIRSRSRSPLPQPSSPTTDGQHRRSPSPSASPPFAVPQSASDSLPPSPAPADQNFSPSDMSPTASHHPQRPGMGHSGTSDMSVSAEGSAERTRSNSYKRYSGTVNHYGRHSNDWLFGGFSVRDTLRDGIEKLKGNSERDS